MMRATEPVEETLILLTGETAIALCLSYHFIPFSIPHTHNLHCNVWLIFHIFDIID